MRFKKFFAVLVSVALSAVSTVNQAVAQTQTQTFTAELPVLNVPADVTINFPQFDPAQGTPTKIRFFHDNAYAGQGFSAAVGGTFVPPNWVAGWAFGGFLHFAFSGPGFDNTNGPFLTRGGSSTQPNPEHLVEFSFNADVYSSPVVCLLPEDDEFTNYIGTGTIETSFSTEFVPDAGNGWRRLCLVGGRHH